ncbi:MAG TPA: NAD(P)-dependent oxidoreductase [Candidatus Eremiobacteraceae bacterium]|nr:NAD(P)-dependent oxidoreductase [Candidatus Eremiobacteraceae bacterium]
MATIAFLGIGLMGSAMASRLRAAGHDLRVWNRTPAKADAWAKDGGTACATPMLAAQRASQAHLMLADDAAVNAALFGPDGAMKGLDQSALVVDHSTVSVYGTGERAQAVKRAGLRYVHAPMLAGPANVVRGEGVMLVAGVEEAVEAASATLTQILPNRWYLGSDERDAATMKLMANSMLLAITEALAEFFTLGRANGIAPERAFALFQHWDPSRTIPMRGARMVRGEHAPAAFFASMAAKDAALMLEAARDAGVSLPIMEIVWKRLRELIEAGKGDLDLSALGLT